MFSFLWGPRAPITPVRKFVILQTPDGYPCLVNVDQVAAVHMRRNAKGEDVGCVIEFSDNTLCVKNHLRDLIFAIAGVEVDHA